jgi:hypothetical protein
MFAGGFDFSFPAVDGFDGGGVDVDAGGEVFLEEGAGDFAGFGEGGAGYEDEAELGGGCHVIREEIVTDFWNGADMRHGRGRINAENAESAEGAEKNRKKRKKIWDVGS